MYVAARKYLYSYTEKVQDTLYVALKRMNLFYSVQFMIKKQSV